MTENGPCYVNEFSNGTFLNPYSLNQHSNVLYIDQPVQAGFSYSTFMNSTFDFNDFDPYATSITPIDSYDGNVPAENATFKYGIWADQNPDRTANTTENAMKPLWHFLQGWFEKYRRPHLLITRSTLTLGSASPNTKLATSVSTSGAILYVVVLLILIRC